MQLVEIVEKVQKSLDDQTKKFGPQEISWFKQRFESIMLSQFFDEKLAELKMSFVVDANVVVSSILRYAKGEGSILVKLAGNPLFELLAPEEIEEEVVEALEEKSAENGLRKSRLLRVWEKVRRSIKISEVRSRSAIEMARRLIGKRDPKDLPYVAMFIETQASGVLTYDADHEESPEIRRFSMGDLNEAVASFHRGIFMFVALADVGVPAISTFGEVSLLFIKTLLSWLAMFMQLAAAVVASAASGLLSLFSRIPSGVQQTILWALLFGAIGIGVWMLFDKDSRAKAKDKIGAVWNRIKSEIKRIIAWIADAAAAIVARLKVLSRYTLLGATVVAMLAKDIGVVLKAARNFQYT